MPVDFRPRPPSLRVLPSGIANVSSPRGDEIGWESDLEAHA